MSQWSDLKPSEKRALIVFIIIVLLLFVFVWYGYFTGVTEPSGG
jgi:hypothetical protein